MAAPQQVSGWRRLWNQAAPVVGNLAGDYIAERIGGGGASPAPGTATNVAREQAAQAVAGAGVAAGAAIAPPGSATEKTLTGVVNAGLGKPVAFGLTLTQLGIGALVLVLVLVILLRRVGK